MAQNNVSLYTFVPLTVTQSTILVFLAVLLVGKLCQIWRRMATLPPGPVGWPIVGHLPMLGAHPHLYFMKLWKKYGPFVYIRMGSRDTLIVNGYKACQDVFLDPINGNVFADRPDFESFKVLLPEYSPDFTMTPYTESWKLKKKTVTAAFKIITTKETTQDLIWRKASDLADKLGNQPKSIDPRIYIKNAIANVLLPLVFGMEEEFTENPVLTDLFESVESFIEYQGAGGNPGDLLPWVSYIYHGSGFNKFIKSERRLAEISKEQFEEHKNLFKEDNIKDMIDALILTSKHIRKQKLDLEGSEDEKHTEVRSIVGAGLATTATVIQWMFIYMAAYPEFKEQVYEEICKVIGNERQVKIEDMASLPFTKAYIYEILRHTTIVPLAVPHATRDNTKINGYVIPKGTLVFPNLWSVSRDETIWKNPEIFDPNRFLTDDGNAFDKKKGFLVLTFGCGKRRCPGEQLAILQLFIFFVTLLQKLDINVDKNHSLEFDCEFGLALDPKPFKVLITPRKI